MLDEKARERLRTLTVDLILALRAEYLRSGHGNVLKHWEQLETRLRVAAATSGSPEEFATRYSRGLQLVALSKAGSQALIDLADTVRELGSPVEWFRMLDEETAYLMALARKSAEQRSDARAEAALSREAIEEAARKNGLLEE
jgi:hypothetical protein